MNERLLTDSEIRKCLDEEADLTYGGGLKAISKAQDDKTLKALKTKGLRVNNISLEHPGEGTVVFIPDEKEEKP